MRLSLFLPALLSLSVPAFAQSTCVPGTYRADDGDFVILLKSPAVAAPGLRYQFRDGRRGATNEQAAPLRCDGTQVTINGTLWSQLAFRETEAGFDSVGTRINGRLIEPAGPVDPQRPLVVFVHGSERSSPIGGSYGYALAAQGLSVFLYDKRGTGGSDGEYTQNFELLAADAAAALNKAREVAQGRFGRAGFFGGSQGGWVAPLAATHSKADFVAIGFGLVASPIAEDREQMVSEVHAMGLGPDALALVEQLSAATSRLLLSNFTAGYDDLDKARAALAGKPWAAKIEGEHSGAISRMSNADLKRLGRARFDNLELIWDYDAVAALNKLDAPLLWVLAGEDREAPIAATRTALLNMRRAGKPVDVYLFPETDHGMYEFVTNADGSRDVTRITDGYFKLLGDWIKRDVRGSYGRGQNLTGAAPNPR